MTLGKYTRGKVEVENTRRGREEQRAFHTVGMGNPNRGDERMETLPCFLSARLPPQLNSPSTDNITDTRTDLLSERNHDNPF